MSALVHVWEPFELKGIELRNRIVRGAHTTALARDGVGDALIRYHVERARGGVALSVIEAAGVHPTCAYGIPIQEDAVMPGLRRLGDAVRPLGMHLIQQLFHIGPHGPTPDGSPSWAASYIPGAAPGQLSHPMTIDEIQEVVSGFAVAARRVREAGLAGVEVHCSHGYLLHSFLSAATNLREDEYGGSFENRLRLTREVIAAIRAEVGEDYLVGLRLSTEDGVTAGTGAEECVRIAQALEADGGIDYLSLSCGNSGYQPARVYAPLPAPRGYEVPYSARVTRAVALPTMVTGRILSLKDAEEVLARGDADLVSMVRALLADAHLVEKTRTGRVREVRPCIGCNQSCVGGIRRYDGSGAQRLECAVSPAAGHELLRSDADVPRAERALRVVVAGGGPAGLEAARIAALAGHSVELHERSEALGGQLRVAGANRARAETLAILDWWEHEVRRLGVELRLSSEVGTALAAAAEVLVVATGSRPRRDGFQSLLPAHRLDCSRVLTSWDVLSGAGSGPRAVVYDDVGHYEAIDVAESLLDRGVEVRFVTRYSTVGGRLDGGPFAWEALGQPHQAHLLEQSGFSLHTRSYIASVDPDGVTIGLLDAREHTARFAADTVVMVSGNVPERALADALPAAQVVGDALYGPRFLPHAVLSGHEAARALA